jgi:hypothetical protein
MAFINATVGTAIILASTAFIAAILAACCHRSLAIPGATFIAGLRVISNKQRDQQRQHSYYKKGVSFHGFLHFIVVYPSAHKIWTMLIDGHCAVSNAKYRRGYRDIDTTRWDIIDKSGLLNFGFNKRRCGCYQCQIINAKKY